MTAYNFRSFPAIKRVKFTCLECAKPNRQRTLRVEFTVNPFNTNDDGTVRTEQDVRAQSQAACERDAAHFLTKPLCAECESKLSFKEQIALSKERRVVQS